MAGFVTAHGVHHTAQTRPRRLTEPAAVRLLLTGVTLAFLALFLVLPLVVVFVEEGGNGGSVAAPIAKRIALALNGDLNPPEVKLVPPKTPGGDR